MYERIMQNGGKIYMKTDNAVLFNFSVNEFKECGWVLSEVTRDLHKEPYAAELVTTEYEEKFMGMGKPILRLVAEKDK
jgi:tRNA (guanine-N7-)-methyltransferase